MYTHLNAWTLSHTGFTQHRTQHLKIYMTALCALQSLTHTLALDNYSLHTPQQHEKWSVTCNDKPHPAQAPDNTFLLCDSNVPFLFFSFFLTLAPHSVPLYSSLSASRTCLSLFQSGWSSVLCRWHGFEQFGRRSHHLVLWGEGGMMREGRDGREGGRGWIEERSRGRARKR